MLTKTANMSEKALDWAVAVALGAKNFRFDTVAAYWMTLEGKDVALSAGWGVMAFCPSTQWARGGPILTKARISRTVDHSGQWVAYITSGYGESEDDRKFMHCDRSELIAGLRCFVESKLGVEVDVPAGLL